VVNLTIVARKGHPDLGRTLQEKLASSLCVSETVEGEWRLLLLTQKDRYLPEARELAVRGLLADALEAYILEELREPLLQEMIRKHYYYFSRQEREKVLQYSGLRDSTAGKQTRQLVREQLSGYLKNCRHLNIPGLIRFRLGDYLAELRKTVEGAVDDFLIEKEYQEFIKLLKYFVEIQEPKIQEAHVLLDKTGRFQIRDGRKRLVEQDTEEMNAAYLRDPVDSEDMLVSALVTAAPGRVILHRQVDAQYPKLSGTLKKIFDVKLSICRNCHECAFQAKATGQRDP
jgi:putative sporulation protein YtxC